MTTEKAQATIAFTLIEVMVALSILAIALVVLLNLQLASIRMTDRAERMSRAARIAYAKMAETLAGGAVEIGTTSGVIEAAEGEPVLHWRAIVTERQIADLEPPGLTGLRDVYVEVTWNEGAHQERVHAATCAVREREK
jgi:general secretion pathway protein I